MKVRERTKMLRSELEKQFEECQRMANEFVETERRKMEERMWQQQQEVEKLKWRLQEIETQFSTSSNLGDCGDNFARRLLGSISATDDPGNIVKSMDLDMGDQESFTHEIFGASVGVDGNELFGLKLSGSVRLSTMFEEEEAGEGIESCEDEEVEKEIIKEKRICSSTLTGDCSPGTACLSPCCQYMLRDRSEHVNAADTASSRHMRIQAMAMGVAAKENCDPHDKRSDSQIEVYVKWEASKETAGKFITTLKVVKEATLADLRKLIEIFLAGNNRGFAFLVLGMQMVYYADANDAPIPKEKEATILASKASDLRQCWPPCLHKTSKRRRLHKPSSAKSYRE